MANQKGWLKTRLLYDKEDDMWNPDFHKQEQSGYSTIIQKGKDVLMAVCAPVESWSMLMQLSSVTVWLNVGDENIINNVIAEAEAMGGDENMVRSADVLCDVSESE